MLGGETLFEKTPSRGGKYLSTLTELYLLIFTVFSLELPPLSRIVD